MKTVKLFVFHDDDNSFSNFSREALDYLRDDFALALNSSEDYLYVGNEKPINAFFVEMSTVNSEDNKVSGEFYNGTTWKSLEGFMDSTNGLKRSDFIVWDRNQTDEAKITVNSQEAFWYRFRPSVTFSAQTRVLGVNIVFSSDNDLKEEICNITDADEGLLPNGEVSFISKHLASRNDIIQKIRNDGRTKQNLNTGEFKDINAFDLLNFGQVRQASKYLTLSKIFLGLSDSPEDSWERKSRKYESLYTRAISLFFLELDQDDDGLRSEHEEQTTYVGTIVRR